MKNPLSHGKDRAAWPVDASEVGALMRRLDWSESTLGPVAGWPHRLSSAIELMLPSPAQIVTFWGPRFITFYNDAYAAVIGQKHPAALGHPGPETWPELWDEMGPLLERVRGGGEAFSARDMHFQLERHGFLENVYFDIACSPLRGDAGQVDGVLCIVSETTERVRYAQALVRREAELAKLTQSLERRLAERTTERDRMWRLATDMMLVVRFDGVIEAVNPAWTSLLGWPVAELLGRPLLDFVHPADHAVTEREFERLAEGLITRRFDNRYRHRDGSHRTIRWNAVAEEGATSPTSKRGSPSFCTVWWPKPGCARGRATWLPVERAGSIQSASACAAAHPATSR
jgi:PAS domain S-box-containing protein